MWQEGSLVGMVGVLVTVEVWTLELFGQQLAEALGHGGLAAAQSQTVHLFRQTQLESDPVPARSEGWSGCVTYLSLGVGLQS